MIKDSNTPTDRGHNDMSNTNAHRDPAADGARGAKLDNAIAALTDEIQRHNRNIAMAEALEHDTDTPTTPAHPGTGSAFNFAAADTAVASLEAELQDCLEASPLYDWANDSYGGNAEQHLRYDINSETYTICDGPRPARS